MTNEAVYTPCKYRGNGSTSDFSFTWKILNVEDIIVQFEDVVTGIQTEKTYGTDYTVTFNETGGYIQCNTAPSSDYYVVISRNVSDYQSKTYSTSTGFQGSEIENSFDRVSCNVQELEYDLQRSIKVQKGSSSLNLTLTEPGPHKALKWNSDGTGIENSTLDVDELESVAQRLNASIDNIDTVAENITDVNTCAGDKTNIDTCAANISAITSAPTYAANAHVWAEGSDIDVQTLGGVHSSKGWAEVWNDRARIISVKDFGAKGDGTTDDTTAIQTAINNCAASEGLLFFPAGTYICEGLNVPAIRLVGCGRKSILKLKSNAENNLINVTADRAIIENITLDGNKTNQTGKILSEPADTALREQIELVPTLRYQLGMNSMYTACNNFASAINCGIFINVYDNIIIRDCFAKDFVNCGVAAKGCNNLTVIYNNIKDCGDRVNEAVNRGCGVLVFNSNNSFVDKNIVDGCTGFNVLFQYGCYDSVISFNKLLNSSYIGSGNGQNHRCKIIGNYVAGCADNGIDMQQAHDVTVIGNTCYNNGTTGGGAKVNLFWGTDYQTEDSNAIFANNKFIKTDEFIEGGGGAENIQIYSPHNGFSDGTKLQYMPKHVIFTNNYVYGGNYRTLDGKYIKTENNIFEKVVTVGASCIASKFSGNLFKSSDLQFTGGVRDLQIFGNTFVACGAQSDGRDADNEKYAIAFITASSDTSVHMEINIENNTFELPDLTYKVLKENYVTSNRMSAIYVKNNKIIANGNNGVGEEGIKLKDVVSYPLFSVNPEKVVCFNNILYADAYEIGNHRSTMQYPAVLSANKTDTSITYLPPVGYTKVAVMSERTVTGVAGHSYMTIFEIYRDPHVYDANKPTVSKFTGIDTGNFTASVDNDTNVVTFTTTTVPNDGVYIVILEHQSLY